MTPLRTAASAVWLWLAATAATAQQPVFSDAATQPSPDRFTLRTLVEYTRLDRDPTGAGRRVDDTRVIASLTAGLTADLAFNVTAPLVFRLIEARGVGDDTRVGADRLSTTLRWRVHREDSGPLDTFRVALLASMDFRMPGEISGGGYNPGLGAVATWIRGRHGFNLGGRYLFTSGARRDPLFPGETLADYLRADASYLFRLAPETYGADTSSAWYAVLECNGRYETDGEHQVFLSPGLLFEAATFAIEAGLRLPVSQDLSRRPEQRVAVALGVRVLF